MTAYPDVTVVLTKPLITPANEGLRTYQAGDSYVCKIDKAYQLCKNGDATFPQGFDVLSELYFEQVADLHQEIKNKDNIEQLKNDVERLEHKLQLQKTNLDGCIHDLGACKWFIFGLTAALTIYTSYVIATWWITTHS